MPKSKRQILQTLIMNIYQLRYFFCLPRKIISAQICKQQILKTTQLVSDIASITLGPKGRNVAIQNNPSPRITKDGVTVVKHLQFKDRLQDAILALIKKSVSNTNQFAGDGTTTSTILIGAIVKAATKHYAIKGNLVSIRKGLNIGKDIGLDYFESVSKKLQTPQQLLQVAMISTNKNHKIANLVSEVVSKAQTINIEKSSKSETYVEYYSGLKFTRGIPNQLLINAKDKIIYNYPLVLVSQTPITKVKQILKPLQMAKRARKQLVIFAQDISDSVMSTLIYNNQKKIVQVCGIKVPAYGEVGKELIYKIAKSSQAYIFNRFSEQIQNIQWNHFGKVIKMQVDKFETLLLGKQNQQEKSAIIFVGGNTEEVLLETYDKMIDALNSVKSAKKNGVVAGGGVTYWRLSQLLQNYQGQHEQGVKVLAQALREPRRKLFASYNPLRAFQGQGWKVYDLKGEQMQDMFKIGVLDSLTVAKNTLIDSVSLASLLIDTDIAMVLAHQKTREASLDQLSQSYKKL